MFNLIPDTLKEKIMKDYSQRRMVVWFFSFFILLCMCFIFLLPSYVQVFFEEKNTRAEADVVKNSLQFKKADEVARTIKETNEQLRILARSSNPVNPIDAIQKIVETKNIAIHVYEIEYTEAKATTSTILLKGTAEKREALKDFVTSLEGVRGFSEVVLPVSNFAKEKDIDFTISIIATAL